MADDHGMQLADEQAANGHYQQIMRDLVARKHPIAVSRSALWTGTGLPIPTEPQVGPLIGRVGLSGPDSSVGGTNFYIGPWHVEQDGLTVFSWAADVAGLFYSDRQQDYELDQPVAVRRTMHLGGPHGTTDQIEDFSDEWLDPSVGTTPFARGTPVSVPRPPRGTRSAPKPPPATPHAPDLSPPVPRHDRPGAATDATTPTVGKRAAPLRAEAAVRAALAAPRGPALKSVLATLQPDQYDLVTRPADQPLVVQGHPGTGKTIIAAHRAAYLVHPERARGGRSPRILLIGPNDQYTRHVSAVLESLVPAATSPVTTMGMAAFLATLRRIMARTTGPTDGAYFEVSIELGDFADAAAHELRLSGAFTDIRNAPDHTRLVYEALRANHAAGVDLTDDPEWIEHLQGLPRWAVAVTSRRLLPLLAQCAYSAHPPSSAIYDHVIVDEAQDVRPLEWRLLKAVNPSGRWTLLGDMNQRRSDWSYHSWTHVARDLELIDEDAECSPTIFTRGYRSTAAIIAYANRLLPKDQRTVDSLQNDGPPPRVVRTSRSKLMDRTLDIAVDLNHRHTPGTTAVIAVDAVAVHQALLQGGWTLDHNGRGRHQRGTDELYLLTPDAARGLEFDAVVVVEPADFPPNLGRMGSLYTSLTRANRELAVVHARPLPDGLRSR